MYNIVVFSFYGPHCLRPGTSHSYFIHPPSFLTHPRLGSPPRHRSQCPVWAWRPPQLGEFPPSGRRTPPSPRTSLRLRGSTVKNAVVAGDHARAVGALRGALLSVSSRSAGPFWAVLLGGSDKAGRKREEGEWKDK